MKHRLLEILRASLDSCVAGGILDAGGLAFIELEAPREEAHGDYATNVAMILASRAKKSPRKIAESIVEHIKDREGILQKVEIAGPGFINFYVKEDTWARLLEEVERLGDDYGRSEIGRGQKVMVEFVSANPTGPLHVGHARGAVIGDVIANILKASGYSVTREYYVNDVGNQMNNLGRSVYYRYLEIQGKAVDFPAECYQGGYIFDLAREILKKEGDRYLEAAGVEEAIPFFTDYAARSIMKGIQDDLRAFGVVFDIYFSEKDLYKNEEVAKLLDELKRRGLIYEAEDALWFKSTQFGDEKDRVVVRENNTPTYFAADIAYHHNKYVRGFDLVIDVWGADHHGYIPRVYASIEAFGHGRERLKIVLVQLVSLLRHGKPVAMSTRTGEFVTLRAVVDEVGKDAARYNFMMRRSDSHLDFDLDLAKRQSNENPVYYVQYVHARISSILRTALERGFAIPGYREIDPGILTLPEEIALIKGVIRFPEVVEAAARALEPHRLTFYLNDLAGTFHSYYNKNRVISEDPTLSRARLYLVRCIGQVVRNALTVLGVTAPEKM
jgi:arginyl-tRNA synthetase